MKEDDLCTCREYCRKFYVKAGVMEKICVEAGVLKVYLNYSGSAGGRSK